MITIEDMKDIEKDSEHEENLPLSVEEAIKISKLICSVSEERIPMILNVLEKAGVYIQGLDELEEWKALKEQAYIIDIVEFYAELIKNSFPDEKEVYLRPAEFSDVCEKFNVKPSCAKRALHRNGLIRTIESPQGKINYTVPVWKNGKAERYIVILKKGAD